ncbi:MAG: biotin/lipoyl-containing protein, partial [Pseudomonadota bacterium]
MGVHVIKLPDVGEGVAEAELVEWMVKTGDNVMEDQILAAVMTDKATVEIPSPVIGKVIWVGAKAGDTVSVGSPIVKLEVDGAGNAKEDAAPAKAEKKEAAKAPQQKSPVIPVAARSAESQDPVRPAALPPHKIPDSRNAASGMTGEVKAPRKEGEKPLASPAVRKRAMDAGVDLRRVPGTGPAGRITHEDLDQYFEHGSTAPAARGRAADTSVKEIQVIGLRRKIAEKMTISRSRIPDIVYVEEIDVTALEDLRAKLNTGKKPDRAKLTILPFLMRAMAKAIEDQPQIN